MGMPMRQGRHAKQKQRKRVRLRGPDPISHDEPCLAAGVQASAEEAAARGQEAASRGPGEALDAR